MAEHKSETAATLRATFRAYMEAEARARRAYIGYQNFEVGEVEVHRLQRAEADAKRAHEAAIEALSLPPGKEN